MKSRRMLLSKSYRAAARVMPPTSVFASVQSLRDHALTAHSIWHGDRSSSLVGGFQRRDSSYEDFVQEQKKEAARARAQATRAAATTPAPTPAITAVTPTIVHALSADTCTASEVPVPEPSAPLGTTPIKGIARKVKKTLAWLSTRMWAETSRPVS